MSYLEAIYKKDTIARKSFKEGNRDDVEIVEVVSLDEEHAKNFTQPFLVVFSDNEIVEFGCEESACSFQRRWRAQIN